MGLSLQLKKTQLNSVQKKTFSDRTKRVKNLVKAFLVCSAVVSAMPAGQSRQSRLAGVVCFCSFIKRPAVVVCTSSAAAVRMCQAFAKEETTV